MDQPYNKSEDRNQRIPNESKREELARKYGARFQPEGNSDLPPQVEAEWLAYIEEFERQFEDATRTSVREYLGSPSAQALADIPPHELEAELDRLLDMLAEHGVYVDFLHDVATREAYRFITEELLDEGIDDIRIPGLQHHFIYEEFHPNEEDEDELRNDE